MDSQKQCLCPSAPGAPGQSVLIGVVTNDGGRGRVVPTSSPLPVTIDLLSLAEPVSPSEVFRFAAPCRSSSCVHFKQEQCELAARGVSRLEEVASDLPKCSIRPRCRWFQQEGAAICRRCPQVITDVYSPSGDMLYVVFGEEQPQ